MVDEFVFIPARAGSKGVPNKNLQSIGGISLVRRTIDFALSEFRPEQVVLSSDSRDILQQGEGLCRTCKRGPALSDDKAQIGDVVVDFFNMQGKIVDPDKAVVYLLEPTAPFRSLETLRSVRAKMARVDRRHDVVITITQDASLQYYGEDFSEESLDFDLRNFQSNRQCRRPKFREANAVFAASVRHLMEKRVFKANQMGFVEVGETEAIDINSPFDLALARWIWSEKEVNSELF